MINQYNEIILELSVFGKFYSKYEEEIKLLEVDETLEGWRAYIKGVILARTKPEIQNSSDLHSEYKSDDKIKGELVLFLLGYLQGMKNE